MPETKASFASVRFQDFELDLQSGELLKTGAQTVRLPEQSFQILKILLEHSGKVVSRADIQRCLWPDGTIVEFEHSIGAAINRLRQVLGDTAENPRFIETLTRRGYRWIAGADWAVQREPDSPAEEVAKETPHVISGTRPLIWWSMAGAVTLILGLALARNFYSRNAGRLTEKDTIVLSDFTNTTGDPVFDDTLKQGLRVQLEQSPFINVLSEQKVDQELKLMMTPSGGSLTPELARELCQRAGSSAVVSGSISRLGAHYVLGLNAFNCHTGQELDTQQLEIKSREQILDALTAAVQKMRLKLGESAATVQKFGAPLEQATTANLEALKAYSFGMSKWRKGDVSGAIPLFQKAIDLDSGFAMAYLQLGRSYSLLGRYAEARDSVRNAYELRARASERERFDIVAGYHQTVSFDLQQTIANCELWEQSYPREFVPHRILGFENGVLGNYERSAEEFAKARDLDPEQAIPYAGLIEDYTALNRLAEAQSVYEDAKSHHVAAGLVESNAYLLAFARNDAQEMARINSALSGEPGFEITALKEASNTAAYYGHFSAARALTARMKELAVRQRDTAVAADVLSDAAFREELVGNIDEAHRYAAEAAKLGGEPTTALMLTIDPDAATNMVDRFEQQNAPDGLVYKVRVPLIRGAIELKRGNSARALELFAPALPYESGWFDLYTPAYLRGEAYLLAHRGPEAATEFEKIVSHTGVVLNTEIGAVAFVCLARAYVMQGDNAKAKSSYQNFFTLWKDADADVPILKQAKREYATLQ